MIILILIKQINEFCMNLYTVKRTVFTKKKIDACIVLYTTIHVASYRNCNVMSMYHVVTRYNIL